MSGLYSASLDLCIPYVTFGGISVTAFYSKGILNDCEVVPASCIQPAKGGSS